MTLTKMDSTKLIKGVIMLALMFGIGMIPASEPLTQYGMQIIGIFVGVVFGWIFIDIGAPTIIAMVVMLLTQAEKGPTLFAGVFGTQNAMMLMAVFFLVTYVESVKLDTFIANWMMRRKFVAGRPFVFLFLFTLTGYVTTIVTTGMAALFLMINLYKGIAETSGYKRNSKAHCLFLLAALIGTLLAAISLPIKPVVITAFGIYSSATGLEVDALRFSALLIVVGIGFMMAYTLICKFIFRTDLSQMSAAMEELRNQPAVALKPEQKRALIVLLTFIGVLLIPSVPLKFGLWTLLKSIGTGGLGLLALSLFWFITIDGEPIMDLRILTKGFNWDMWFIACFVSFITGKLTSADTGVQLFMSEKISPILNNFSSGMLIIVLIIITVILTNTINNMVALSIMVAFTAVLAPQLPGISLQAVAFVLLFSAYICYMLPTAAPNVAMVYGMKDMVEQKNMIFYGSIASLFLTIYIIVVAWPLAQLVL